jgi:hypothetical protein
MERLSRRAPLLWPQLSLNGFTPAEGWETPFPQRSTVDKVRKSHWPFCPERTEHLAGPGRGTAMSIASEILSLRKNQSSSMRTLLGSIEWQKAAQDDEHVLSRGYAVTEAADIVLLNVAVHAADALSEPPRIRRNRRAVLPRRKSRRSNPGDLYQRRLFA